MAALIARALTNVPLNPAHLIRFAHRQRIDITPFNGNRAIGYLQVTQRWWYTGVAAGVAAVLASIGGGLTISPLPFVVGWFLGALVAALVLAGGPQGRPIGIRLAPPVLVVCWKVAVALGCALAGAAVARSFRAEVEFGERLWAVLSLGAALAVHLLVRNLDRRALPAGPADLVGVELAIRSRQARTLLALGATVTLWAGLKSGLPEHLAPVMMIFSYGLPLVAWVAAAYSWQVTPARQGRAWPWPPAAALLLAVAVLVNWTPPQPDRPAAGQSFSRPATYAHPDDKTGWWEITANGQIEQATAYISRREGLDRPGPFALSGDGMHAVYLSYETRRMVHHDLSSGETRYLTGPLTDEAVPEPVLSENGGFVTLTGDHDTELINLTSMARIQLPGVGRVLGIGPDTVVATTGHRALDSAPETELRTIGHDGTVRTRVPFDPTMEVRLSPDARTLMVLTDTEVVSMDPGTGKVIRRGPLSVGKREITPRALGWAGDGRLLIGVDRDNYLLDLATGKTKEFGETPDDAVFGRVR